MTVRKPPSELLLEFLASDGVLDSASVERLRVRLWDEWVPLGKVLRRTGKLSMAQLFAALQEQSQNPELRLGDICVGHGFCTEADVREAVSLQVEDGLHLIDLLLTEQHSEPAALLRSISRYVRVLETRANEASALSTR